MSSAATLEQLGTPRGFGTSASRSEGVTKWFERTSSIPPEIAWIVSAEIWFTRVEAFREQEEEALLSDHYSARLGEHREALSRLISRGETLVFHSGYIRLPMDFSEFSIADVKAAVASLHTTFRCQHGPKNHPSVDSQIEKLFDVEKSPN